MKGMKGYYREEIIVAIAKVLEHGDGDPAV